MNFKRLTSLTSVREYVTEALKQTPTVVIDLETTGLNPRTDKIVDVVITTFETEDTAIIFSGEWVSELKGLDTCLLFHNSAFDLHFLYTHGVDLRGCLILDTMLLHHLIDENASHALDSLVKEQFSDNYKEVFWGKYDSYEEASNEDKLDYACKDVIYTKRLYHIFRDKLRSDFIPDWLINHVHKLARALLDAEIVGIAVDIPYLTDLGVRTKSQIERIKPQMRALCELECQIWEYEEWTRELEKRTTEKGKAGVEKPKFSFDSSKQLTHLLYKALGLPSQNNERTKNVSVDDASLEKIKDKHPLISLIQQYRALQKVYGTYVEGTLERIESGRIYPSFKVNGTVTGRISHSNPNLGQLPAVGGVRGIYIPDAGSRFISADYSSLEVVVEANLTEDKNLIKILQEGLSKHDITAQELQIDRTVAKTLNFAMQYHCSAYKVAKILGISKREAEYVWNKYWEVYSGPKTLKDLTDKEINEQGYIVNMVGRKRRFGIKPRMEWDGDYRAGYNFKIQGPGAEFTNLAFYTVADRLRENGHGRAVLSVHDEIIIQVKEAYIEEEEKALIDIMESVSNVFKLTYPLKAVSSGPMKRWED